MLTQEAEARELEAAGIVRIKPVGEFPWVKRGIQFDPGRWVREVDCDNGDRITILVKLGRVEDGLVTSRSMLDSLQSLTLLEGPEYVLELEDFVSKEIKPKQFIDMASKILDDRFVVVSTDQELLPWKGKEKCLKCGYRVDGWSAKKRICDGCRGSLKVTNRVNGGTWRFGNFSASD